MTTPARIAAFLSTSALCLGLSAPVVQAAPAAGERPRVAQALATPQAPGAAASAVNQVAQPQRQLGQVGDQHQAADDHADKRQ